ncbi:MAG: TonB-dependent receptor [Adhaeribacter sp.]
MNCRILLILLGLLCFGFTGQAQTSSTPLITLDIKNATLDKLVQELEAQTHYRFYYQATDFDSLRVSLQVNKKPLADVLTEAFRNTPYNFAIDEQRHVFLLKNQEIKTTLPNRVPATDQTKPSNPVPSQLALRQNAAPTNTPTAALENKLYEIGIKTAAVKAGKATLSGTIQSAKNNSPVIGAAVFVENPLIGTTSNENGFFSITLPTGRHVLHIKSTGLKTTKRQLMLYADGQLNIQLQDQSQTLNEVLVVGENTSNIKRVQMGIERMDIKTIRQVPTLFGEADILRAVLTLPGVKTVGEASTGFNVRGGATDQNLILFNGATIYNPSHFFGFFSAFNPEVVKDVELYKSSIPAKYGGRLSSVLEINSREGNKQKFTGSAGIGLLTSRLHVEGPIKKDQTSFILGGRTTYSNWIFDLLPDKSNLKNTRASFYDLNLQVNHEVNENNHLSLTGYYSQDQSNLNTDTLFNYGNRNIVLKWARTFNKRLFGTFTTGQDRYQYDNYSEVNPVNAFRMAFGIKQAYLKGDFVYTLNPKHTLNFGLNTLYYQLQPGSFKPLGTESLIVPLVLQPEQALESALYLGDKYEVSPELSLDFGLRYSLFNYLGPQAVNTYAPNLPKEENNQLDSVFYKSGKIIKTYHGPEWRFAARYALTEKFSVKLGYNTMRQYIHQLSNTTAIAPTDVYKLSDANIRPQFGSQVSLGLYRNFRANSIETSVEVYYKRLRDYLDYKSGALLVLNPHLETDVINTGGKAYGAEFMVKKLSGKLNGWVSYTYSRTLLRMNDPNAGEIINNGNYYPANFDKPHDFTLISNYRLSHRVSFSTNVTYSTGRPITIPIGTFYYAGSFRTLYGDRNSYRIPDYFRTDLSLNIEGNHKLKQLTHNSWTVGVYNVTGRKNPYSTYFTSEKGVINGYKLTIFAQALPFVNYNIKF